MKNLNKRELQAKHTQELLLKTSIHLIIEKGYDNVTISEICNKCKVAKGTFYTHFNSKKDILIRILADINEKLFSEININDSSSTTELMMNYIECYMKAVQIQGVDFTRVFLEIIIDKPFDPELVKSHLHTQLVEQIINKGKEEGTIRGDLSTNKLARYMKSFIFGLMIDWINQKGEYDILSEGKLAITTFMDMMRPKM